tara:strand:- start:7144 stop:8007 length:864 start_codon:yes stop_codon:yes gene_type:complete
MRSIYDLKIFIQSNPQQELAAKVSSFSFNKFGFKNIEIIKLKDIVELNDKFNKKYLRGGKKIVYDEKDLQSFTLLRFLPPKIYDDYCLVIDPDVFAVKDPANILENYVNSKNFQIFCTKKNGNFKSEVCLINCKNFDLWSFDQIITDLFNNKIDYQRLINFDFVDQEKIGNLNNSLNVWDDIDEKTTLLHTTNRLTQPWKEGLKIDFKVYISKMNYIKNFIKRILKQKHNNKIFEKKYKTHPNSMVLNYVEEIFKEAYIENFITADDINFSIKNNFISKKFIERLKL